jgi:hypothetical protein
MAIQKYGQTLSLKGYVKEAKERGLTCGVQKLSHSELAIKAYQKLCPAYGIGASCFGTYTDSNGDKLIGRQVNGKFHGIATNLTLRDSEWKGDVRVGYRNENEKFSDRPVSKNNLNEIVNTIVELCSPEDKRFADYQLMENFAGDQRYKEIVSCLPGPPPEKSLAALRPDIAKDFHPSKNAPLTPWHFFPGGGQKVWWLCPNDTTHHWQTTPNSRTYGGYGCPICSGMKASPTNNLAVLHPMLMLEWHLKKNVQYDPYKIKPGSNYKVWWKCVYDSEHEWQSVIAHRVNGKQKCPICNPFFRSDDNNFAVKFPDLALDWHPSKNGDLRPSQLTSSSSEKVWWLCRKNNDHDWKATVGSRAKLGTGCPVCRGRLCEKNESLFTLSPHIAAEWHPQKNEDLPVDRVKPNSSRIVWWVCKNNNGHVLQEVIAKRVKGSGCPYCAGKRT